MAEMAMGCLLLVVATELFGGGQKTLGAAFVFYF
jgi:hypothetical protein